MAPSWRTWHDRVRADAKKLALRAYEGSLVGPELADAIEDLVQRASAQAQLSIHPEAERHAVAQETIQ